MVWDKVTVMVACVVIAWVARGGSGCWDVKGGRSWGVSLEVYLGHQVRFEVEV